MSNLPAQAKPAGLMTFQEVEKMSHVIVKSGLFGMKDPSQAMALMFLCQAEGLHPMIAVRDYHIIQGRPALKADAALARFQAAGGRVEWHTVTDKQCKATFSHPQGGTVTLDWDLDQAKRAGISGKDVFQKYPRAMLRARVISEAIRTVFPQVLNGQYVPEEVQFFDEKPTQSREREYIDAHTGEVIGPEPDFEELEEYKVVKAAIEEARSKEEMSQIFSTIGKVLKQKSEVGYKGLHALAKDKARTLPKVYVEQAIEAGKAQPTEIEPEPQGIGEELTDEEIAAFSGMAGLESTLFDMPKPKAKSALQEGV